MARLTDPDWEPVMRRVAAIVTDQGGRTAHAAIVSREFGIPCIVGSGNATEIGYSIGSNDLTQLVLGIDRDSGTVAHLFDENDRAVLGMIAEVIDEAHRVGKPIGICGQAPSDFPGFARWACRARH